MKLKELFARPHLGMGYFVHSLPVLAVLLTALNDHYLKYAYPSFLTGKISDFAGVFFFPIFLCALWNISRNLFSSKFHWITLRQGIIAIAVTDLIFVMVKMVPAVTYAYIKMLGAIGYPSRVTRDPGDLAALVMNVATFYFVRAQVRRGPRIEPAN